MKCMDYRLICLDFLSISMRALILEDDFNLADAFDAAAVELGFENFIHFCQEFTNDL